MIELADDFSDLLIELSDANAEFVIVGGYAVAFHGHPRATKELNVVMRSSNENSKRIYRALARYGAPLDTFEVSEADFADFGGVLQIGLPPRRIDILNRISGITFDEAVSESHILEIEGREIRVIGIKALLANKRASAREQDMADISALERNNDPNSVS